MVDGPDSGMGGVVRRPALREVWWIDGLWSKIFRTNWESAEGVEGLGLPLEAVPSKVGPVKLGCHAIAPWTSSRGFKAGSDWIWTALQSALGVCPGRDERRAW